MDGCGGGGGGWGEVEGGIEGGDWEYCGHRVVGEGDDETIYTTLSQTFLLLCMRLHHLYTLSFLF